VNKSNDVEDWGKLRLKLTARIAPVEKLQTAAAKSNEEICQTLGKVLGFPWYKDDLDLFPGATESDGVCVGDHVAETLAGHAADRIRWLEHQLREKNCAILKVANDIMEIDNCEQDSDAADEYWTDVKEFALLSTGRCDS
jgi:hypothetical protein